MPKDPKDWQTWALGIACALVFALGGGLWANAATRLATAESRLQVVEIDHAALKAVLASMKDTIERIDKRMDRR